MCSKKQDMTKLTDLISVVVPVWNIESRYPHALEDLIDSLVNQTYGNLEIILVDDGSTDRSGDICDDYATRDSRVKVYHTPNQGLPAARNYGIEKAVGDFTYFADADDVVHPQCLEVMQRILEAHPECECVVGRYQTTNNAFQPIENPRCESHDSDYLVGGVLKGYVPLYAWNKLMRRDVTDRIKHRITEYEDLDFSLRVALSIKQFILLDQVTYRYVLREQSACRSHLERRLPRMLESLQYLYNHDIKDKHPQYLGDFIWHIYTTYIYNRPSVVGDDNSIQQLERSMKDIKKATWGIFIKSDVSWVKKLAAPILLRWPKLKRINNYIHYKDM